jgi:hypothetical protein
MTGFISKFIGEIDYKQLKLNLKIKLYMLTNHERKKCKNKTKTNIQTMESNRKTAFIQNHYTIVPQK